MLDTLSQHSVTYMVVDHDKSRPDRYKAVLDLREGGSWKWIPLKDGEPVEEGIISGPAAPTPPESDKLASEAGAR